MRPARWRSVEANRLGPAAHAGGHPPPQGPLRVSCRDPRRRLRGRGTAVDTRPGSRHLWTQGGGREDQGDRRPLPDAGGAILAVTYIQQPFESENPKAITYMSPQYEAMLGYPASTEMIDEEHW